jgi:glucose dehydrogenase
MPTTTRANTEAPLTTEGTRFCPGTQGGSEWNGAAFSPVHNLIYVPTADWCATVKIAPDIKEALKKYFTGAPEEEPFGKMDEKEKWRGWLTAFDADSGTTAWQYESPTPLVGGATVVGSDLIFFGDLNGDFFALDAKSGKQILKISLGQPIGGGVTSYSVHGQQFISVAAGLTSSTWQTKSDSSRIYVFGLKQ